MKVMWMILLLSTHWIQCCTAVSEFYSSTDHMTQLIDIQKEFAQCFSDHIAALESQVDLLKRAATVLGHNFDDTSKDKERFISNPLSAYQLVRKLNNVWTTTRDIIEENRVTDTLKKLRSAAEKLPGADDVDGVVLGLLRLQEMYRLDPRNISAFCEMKNNVTLDPDETFHIAVVSYQNEKVEFALLWMQETLRKLSLGENAIVSKEEVQDQLALFSCQLASTQDPLHVRDLPACYANTIESMKTWDWTSKTINLFESQPMQNKYEALCTGKQKPQMKRKLVCRYRTANQMMYAPFKEEEEWHQPMVWRYHDFLSDREIDVIKRLARPKLSRAKVIDAVTGKRFSTAFRVSKSAWLSEDEDPLIAQINQRIADVTGLDLRTAEELQVANYGIGGQYEPHYDSKLSNDSDFQFRGDRIATLLIYMSDVDVGGATVFPTTGAALLPKRGTAVLWFNLLENGNQDNTTLHASCPVFVGNKWVANKWIRAGGQEFRRKCSTVQSE
ncbi:prolyl 4-hydroxylase subunit alpha-2 [Paramisgurnus dabryanus]|uniref:prolyl 4-hydroxylase subunit alpha-2 n=1 Tax=Paramisgurnus dabryanus TaxID=90735 RepID=UPI0031F33892